MTVTELLEIIKEQRRQLTIAYELIEVQEKIINFDNKPDVQPARDRYDSERDFSLLWKNQNEMK